MPIVDITLLRGRTPQILHDIADAVHDALVSEFGIPTDDRFQVIHQKEPYELIFDPTFLGGPRTAEFVMVRVVVGKERPIETKHALYRAIAGNLAERIGIDVEDVFVALDTVALSDLSVAGGRPFAPPHLAPPKE
ncbi:tautomerase family protein [Arthrobacter sp. NPDC080031]|uniref:tautomerase family protein n=1 Tax=Arthrobacter sp. NPDC080031 TaxID=3155918 RepID=UPI00344ED443